MNAGLRASLAAFVALALIAALVAGALASTTSTTTLATIGPVGGNGAFGAFFSALTPDGSRMLFTTEEQLVSEDSDTARDLYERANGVTTLVSTSPTGGNSDSGGVEEGFISADGARVFFETGEPLVAEDLDTHSDIYERSGGVTTWISTGPGAGNGDFDVDLTGMSQDGTRVFLFTEEPLVAADDTDTQADVYERAGGTTTLISTGPFDDPGDFQASLSATSADGLHVFFDTQEKLVADEAADTQQDTYERSGGTTTLVTTGPADAHTLGASVQGISPDGTRAFFQTRERMVAGDTDSSDDVYERMGGTTTLVSTGPASENGAFDATFNDNSADGTRVLFTTAERLVAEDTDSAVDVYQRSGETSLVSAGGNGAFDVTYEDGSEDGTRVFFRTAEPLVATDSDVQPDLYQRWKGATTLVSTGPAGGNGAFPPTFQAASLDGRRVFFTTEESLVSGDTDSQPDVYERSGGETTLVSTGTVGGNGAFAAQFGGASAAGTLMFFSTPEQLVAEDTDAPQADVYQASLSAPTDPPDVPPEVTPEVPKQPDVVRDTRAPQTRITKRPRNRTRKRLAKFRFASTEAGSKFECKLDRKRYVRCGSPRKFKVKRGRHTFRVRAIDAAGNRDATPAIDRWKVLKKK